jgi:protoporphyrin/coproporphyrin ferrochelatase
MNCSADIEALLVISFGGPESREEVMPFLENVTRGRNIPRERLLAVAEHYYHFGGRSPLNDQNRALIAALRNVLDRRGPALPIYWGNRNWHPMLADTIRQMKSDGVTRAAAFITSAFGSYSGCRQYLDDIDRARAEVGAGAPQLDVLPLFWNRSGFLEPVAEAIADALTQFDKPPHVAFTAHSVPIQMAETSPYVAQLLEASGRVASKLGLTDWKLVYQSRSGPPSQPWLEPDIGDHIRELHRAGRKELVIAPIGFISDHMEVVYDLDTEAADLCRELGIRMVRATTVGTHPKFIAMIRDSLAMRRNCPADCCPKPYVRPAGAIGPRGS